ncbi:MULTISPECIES: peptidoglycan-binding protein [unclassified Variovorax]|uniref:peptidoglycan-binding domain-containing protein n=1 Tax=unclassified Variovorax TaxID=663243 RepID=UPI001BD1FCD9|nr:MULTISPECIES: peptidoglycan-binding domain-containing protein [unclassified Variovorax]
MDFVAKAVPMTRQDGPSFAQNQYDVKLNIQYGRFSSGSTPNIEMRAAQAALFLLGYSTGKIDGMLGNRTRDALKGFQVAMGLPVTGDLTGDTSTALCQKAFA